MALVSLRWAARPASVGDFEVRRALPRRERRLVGPVCFLDHMGPHTSVGTAEGGVLPHPHIGLSTVTWLFEGEVLHRDSLGTVQRIRPGEVNWMTAGAGIAHSERTPPHLVGRTSTLHGLQMWVALPLAAEEGPPSFQHASRDALPQLEQPGVSVCVVLGAWAGARSPIALASPTFYAVATLEAGRQLELPTDVPERAVYVVSGDVSLEGQRFGAGELAVLEPGAQGCVTAQTAARVALFGGEPLEGPRHMWWNFVSSRKERLDAARADWKARRWPTIPGDDQTRVEGP